MSCGKLLDNSVMSELQGGERHIRIDRPIGLPRVHDRYNDASAGFKIVSSDNVAFHVERCYVEAGRWVCFHLYVLWKQEQFGFSRQLRSRVFKDMLSVDEHLPANPEISLTDEELETAEVLVILIDLWYGHPFPVPTYDNVFLLQRTLRLMKKYDCPAALYTVHRAIKSYLLEGAGPLGCFVLLADLEDVQGCAMAIERAGGWQWTAGESLVDGCKKGATATSLQDHVPGASAFDVTGWSKALFMAVQPVYSLALLRAAREVPGPLNGKTDWRSVADTFTRLMEPREWTALCRHGA